MDEINKSRASKIAIQQLPPNRQAASRLTGSLDTRRASTVFMGMCRNIRPLFNFEPPATEAEIHAAALQFVRKISGFNKPSHANESAFDQAVRDVSQVARVLIGSLETIAPPRDRAVQAEKARERSRIRFGERGSS